MRGKKVKMLRRAAAEYAAETDGDPRKVSQQFKTYYQSVAQKRSQETKPQRSN